MLQLRVTMRVTALAVPPFRCPCVRSSVSRLYCIQNSRAAGRGAPFAVISWDTEDVSAGKGRNERCFWRQQIRQGREHLIQRRELSRQRLEHLALGRLQMQQTLTRIPCAVPFPSQLRSGTKCLSMASSPAAPGVSSSIESFPAAPDASRSIEQTPAAPDAKRSIEETPASHDTSRSMEASPSTPDASRGTPHIAETEHDLHFNDYQDNVEDEYLKHTEQAQEGNGEAGSQPPSTDKDKTNSSSSRRRKESGPSVAEADVDYLMLSDAELLKQCEVDTYRASGPGGQHRNKTESAVRLRHTPTGCVSQSAEQRSQHLNRETALGRLRQSISLKVRRPVDVSSYVPSVPLLRILPPSAGKRRLPSGVQSIGPKHQDFHQGVRELLDVLAATSCSVSEAASLLGMSTGSLSKVLTCEKALLQQVNDMRAVQGLKPLR